MHKITHRDGRIATGSALSWSAESELARKVCDDLGADHTIRFVEVAEADGTIYVRGTLGKPDEFHWLSRECLRCGYAYVG